MKRIVVLASGSGSNFQAILDAIAKGELHAECAGLVCDRDGIGAIARAENAGVPVVVVKRSDYADVESFSEGLLSTLESLKPDLIVLAGYLRKIPPSVTARWPGAIVNIHPALLPKFGGKGFYGIRVHEAVIAANETESGCTVHWVDEVYDNGDVIAQAKVPVLPDDTPSSLQQRVLAQEHLLFPKVLQQLLSNS